MINNRIAKSFLLTAMIALQVAKADTWNPSSASGVIVPNVTSSRVGIGTTTPNGTLDVRGGTATGANESIPLIFSAQIGASGKRGGNILFNAGPNGSGSINGSIIFGSGGSLGPTGKDTSFTTGERMRLAPNGFLGIGLATPTTVVHIRRDDLLTSGEHSWVSVDRNGANNGTDPALGMGYRADGTNATRVWMGAGNGFPLDFRTSAANQAMSLLNDGRIGIGNPDPKGTLDVRGGTATGTKESYPLILSAQYGASGKRGGNILLNAGPNGTGSINGSIIFGVGGTLGPVGMDTSFTAGERMRLDPNGFLGLGVAKPSSIFHLRRDDQVANGEHSWVSIERNGANNSTDPAMGMGYRADGANPTRVWIGSGNSFPLDFRTSGANQAMTILNNGNVGIGNTQPNFKLDVAGDVNVGGKITVASVATKVWSIVPDYVFEKDYNLASLEQVETFVNKNRHLPEIPSAKEIGAKGIDLAEMNMKLLKKVEELTLYAIKQEKRDKEHELEIARLKSAVSKLSGKAAMDGAH